MASETLSESAMAGAIVSITVVSIFKFGITISITFDVGFATQVLSIALSHSTRVSLISVSCFLSNS